MVANVDYPFVIKIGDDSGDGRDHVGIEAHSEDHDQHRKAPFWVISGHHISKSNRREQGDRLPANIMVVF